MNLLTPPTDSLYKFCAVAGLTLFIYLAYIVIDHDKLFVDRLYHLESKLNNIRVNVELLKIDLLDDTTLNLSKSDSAKIESINIKNIDAHSNINFISKLSRKHSSQYKKLLKEKMIVKFRIDELESQDNDFSWDVILIVILIAVAEVFCLLGVFHWYEKIQKPSDNEYQQKVLSEEFYKDNCQSCFKTFIYFDERGTNSDRSKSKFFCETCYTNGAFTEPELVLSEAKKRLKVKLAELKYSRVKIKRQAARMNDLMRWERSSKW